MKLVTFFRTTIVRGQDRQIILKIKTEFQGKAFFQKK
jgi:hypothetical protein